MQFEKFKNINHLSHLELPGYVRSLIERYITEHGSKMGKLIETVEENLCEYEAVCGEAFKTGDNISKQRQGRPEPLCVMLREMKYFVSRSIT